MISKLVEVTNGFNWGKFLIQKFDQEWAAKSKISESRMPLIRELGWDHRHLFVLDLQTGEGAMFLPGGLAVADLNKHKVWVCPMFQPFLEWLYKQNTADLSTLPDLVTFTPEETAEHSAWQGYRRPGPNACASCGSELKSDTSKKSTTTAA